MSSLYHRNVNRQCGGATNIAWKDMLRFIVPPPPGKSSWSDTDVEKYFELFMRIPVKGKPGKTTSSKRYVGFRLKKDNFKKWNGKFSRTVEEIFTMTNMYVVNLLSP